MSATLPTPTVATQPRRKPVFAVLVLLVAALLSWLGFALQPRLQGVSLSQAAMDQMFPRAFGDWKEVEGLVPLVTANNPTELTFNQPYDAQIMRSYRNSKNQVVMLAIAYGQNQRQDIKVHRPEVCYPAQGWSVDALAPFAFPLSSTKGTPITGKQMLARANRTDRREAVLYWIRIGDTFAQGGMAQRLHIFKQGLQGKRSDGVLVRFSQALPPGQDPQASYQMQTQFASDFIAALSPEARNLLTH